MIQLTTVASLTDWADDAVANGERIGLVPTMGFLHDGHVSLMERLRPMVDRLVVSIFVNPLQFGPDEDLDRYPRDLEGDAKRCRDAGVDALFVPSDFYPADFGTTVSVAHLTTRWCGAARQGHFDGVTTVCCRLFALTRCAAACFGEKDFQQLATIRRMVRDLGLPIEIVPAPLVRDTDGVALSSRNAYLSEDERASARTLSQALRTMVAAHQAGQTDVAALLRRADDVLTADRVDYLAVVDPDTLEPLESVDGPAQILAAAWFGKTRLLDNLALSV